MKTFMKTFNVEILGEDFDIQDIYKDIYKDIYEDIYEDSYEFFYRKNSQTGLH
jgi:hypothetical protein